MNHSTMNIDEMEKGAGKKYKERMELKNGDPTLLKCIKLTIVLPLGAFFFCVIITLIKDFQQATYTHCKVGFFAFECLYFRRLCWFNLTHVFICERKFYIAVKCFFSRFQRHIF